MRSDTKGIHRSRGRPEPGHQARCPHCERLIHWGDGFDEWLYTEDYRLVPFYWKVNGRRLMCQNCGRYSLVPENLWDSAAE